MYLYQTHVVNACGLHGTIRADDQEYQVTSPTHPKIDQATNPEQLLGMSLATCLNATIEAEINRRSQEGKSQVDVWVSLLEDQVGYAFQVDCLAKIDHPQAQEVFQIALSRCPMAKLLGGQARVTIRLEEVDHA